MKIICLILFTLIFVALRGNAQKPALDSSTFGKWPSINNARISNDGNYCAYDVDDVMGDTRTLNIVSNSDDSRLEFVNGFSPRFLGDSKICLFKKAADSLGILDLGTKRVDYIKGVQSFKISEYADGDWYAYLKGEGQQLIVLNSRRRIEKSFNRVTNYLFSEDGRILLVEHMRQDSSTNERTLTWFDLNTGLINSIWTGGKSGAWSFDRGSKQLTFVASESANEVKKLSLYYYAEGTDRARVLLNSDSLFDGKFTISNKAPQFSKTSDKLLFQISPIENKSSSPVRGYTGVDIWNYKDVFLQQEQFSRSYTSLMATQFWAVVNLRTGEHIRLNGAQEYLAKGTDFEDYVVIMKEPSRTDEYHPEFRSIVFLVSTVDGKRKELYLRNHFNEVPYFSPNLEYIVWFDPDTLNYFSYEVKSGVKRMLTSSNLTKLYDSNPLNKGIKPTPFGIAGWSIKRNSILLYDRFDIWELDLADKKPGENVTNYFGSKNRLVFSVVNLNDREVYGQFKLGKGLLLAAFDPVSKKNGFWQAGGVGKDPIMASMADFAYYIPRTEFTGLVDWPAGFRPRKARDKMRFIVSRTRATEYPNYYVTDDFRTFRPISDLHPERRYNWLSTELLKWQMPDGKFSQGILYKPENFDPGKQYPVIFYYYEKISDNLNAYLEPDYSAGPLNIPFYVSNGYLVFTPDIYYKDGHNGIGVVNAVVSAAKYLSRFPWIDSTKMGIQGHSFGGWETNFLVTHSNLFSAACEGSGNCNEISSYGQLNDGRSRQMIFEYGPQATPYGFGVTPWTNPDLYIENSPVFFVGRTTTPLLISHGSNDDAVPFAQAVEMFLALRRAGKKVWLLQYENAGHALGGDDAKDFTIRMKQFFDHYLKGLPPAKWMTQGIPASIKGIESGFEVDSSRGEP